MGTHLIIENILVMKKMLLIKTKPYTPAKRFHTYLLPQHRYITNFFSFFHLFSKTRKTLVTKRRHLISRKVFHPHFFFHTNFSFKILLPYCGSSLQVISSTKQEILLIENFFKHKLALPSAQYCFPGCFFYPMSMLLQFNRSIIGQFLPLFFVPVTIQISFIYDKQNNRAVYTRSCGAVSVKQQAVKKQKLILITLASKTLKLVNPLTYCLVSPTLDIPRHLTVDGKWGYSTSLEKALHVRGVAKNPVDHPNGGRTKAKQPELSPWGWIAKHSK